MKILVISATKAKKYNFKKDGSAIENNFITIRDHTVNHPVLKFYRQDNVLSLQFDDVESDDDPELLSKYQYVVFNEEMAKEIHAFIDRIDRSKPLIINCFAGVSRSGAVGMVLNEYFNRYLENNEWDYDTFFIQNRQIMPNATVSRILKHELFGKPFSN